jgi:hypothetical protein
MLVPVAEVKGEDSRRKHVLRTSESQSGFLPATGEAVVKKTEANSILFWKNQK